MGERLRDKVAIVTGGASGIGAETARQFATEGAAVMLTDVNAELGERVAAEIAAAGGTAAFQIQDVVDEAGWVALAADTEQRFGKLNVLANIAGVSGRSPNVGTAVAERLRPQIDGVTLENFNQVMAVNVTGLFLGTKHAIPAMRRAGGGSIINISSICGIIGSYAGAAYHASKGAVRIFTKAGAVQHAADNIRMNSVHPGFIDTPMTEAGHALAEVREQRMSATPLGRFGRPYDIAMGCLYLASDESAYMTGAELVIDGGVTTA